MKIKPTRYIDPLYIIDLTYISTEHRGAYKFLLLPNFDKKEGEFESEIDKWFYLLKNLSHLDKIPYFLDKRVFQLVFNIAEMSKLTKEQREAYDSDVKAKSDYYASIKYAALEAKEEGREQGAIQKAKTIALRMKNKGLPNEEISAITDLSVQEIENL